MRSALSSGCRIPSLRPSAARYQRDRCASSCLAALKHASPAVRPGSGRSANRWRCSKRVTLPRAPSSCRSCTTARRPNTNTKGPAAAMPQRGNSFVYPCPVAESRVASKAVVPPETQANRASMSGPIPSPSNRAHCGNEYESVTVLEAQASPRYA